MTYKEILFGALLTLPSFVGMQGESSSTLIFSEGTLCFDYPEQVPFEIKSLQKDLDAVKRGPNAMRQKLASITHRVRNPREDIDLQSLYYIMVQKLADPTPFQGQESLIKYSGADEKNLRFLKTDETRIFFEKLFKFIPDAFFDWNPVRFSRADLFHAHLIYNATERDLFLVFHAREYPDDLLAFSPSRFKLLDYFNEQLPAHLSTKNPTREFTRRNFVWSLQRNRMCAVDTTEETYKSLRDPDSDPSTLNQLALSDFGEKGEMAIVNYFPKERAPLFFDFLRGTGKK